MSKKITMADIAAEFGISVVTVSKALSGQKGVSEEMRQRIMEYAQEQGYQKTASAKKAESYKIGVLIGSRYVSSIDSFYGHMYQIFSAKAAKLGSFTMLEILSDEDEKNLVFPKIIGEANVEAVVIMGALSEKESSHVLMKVIHGRDILRRLTHTIIQMDYRDTKRFKVKR